MNSRKEQVVIKRNAELKQQLAANARKLKIEAGLEKVRAVALKMKIPADMLGVCKTISQQLTLLNVQEIRNIQTAIFYPDKGTYINYEYYAKHKKQLTTDINYTLHKEHKAFANKMLKGAGEFYIHSFKGKKLKDWYAYQKTTNQFADKYLEKAESLNYYMFSLGEVMLGISTYKPLSEEEISLFKRFKNVFELAYRRYIDIEKAEAQAREAKIQLALERIRAKTMAMQKSDELQVAAILLFEQIRSLGVQTGSCGFNIWNKEKKTVTVWTSSAEGGLQAPFDMPLTESPIYRAVDAAMKNGDEFLLKEVEGKNLVKHFDYLLTIPGIGDTIKYLRKTGYVFPERMVYHFAFFKNGFLSFHTHESYTEAHDIFKRFAKVFEQTYTRFLDLQNAEVQSRAAQIELAVERVRAKALAMHNSTQILDVVATLRNEMLGLEIPGVVAATIYLQEEEGYIRMWDLSSVTEMEDGFHVSLDVKFKLEETDPGLYIRRVWNNDENYFVEKQDEKDMAITIEWLRQYYPEQAEEVQKFINTTPWKYLSHPTIQLEHGKMSVDIMDMQPPVEMESIMIKMGAAFDLAHKRFVDLQRSEAQIREAQIELALERVRARTMAMQKSDELMETAVVLFDQLNKLGENIERTIIGVMNEEERVVDFWATRPDGSQMDKVQKFPIEEPIVMQKVYAAWQQQKKSIVIDLRGEELESYFQFLKGRSARLKRESFGERRVENFAFFSKGMLGVISADPNTPSDVGLYERFAAVFDQTYTRFLDLQKAEAQARESQIQLALERVRARTMAMQHSDELKDAAALLFQQAKSLGVPAYSCGYNIWEKDDREFTSWMSTQDGSDFNGVPNIPLTEDANFIHYVDSKQKGEQFFVLELRDERMQEHYEYLKTIPAFKAYFDYAQSVGFDLPETQIHHLANFSQGNLLFITLEPCPEFHDVFKRFAAVFEQTYTRFLDLQKAEAQAREAKIEAALERVRSRTMAMFKSNELAETAVVLFKQMIGLGIEPNRLYIAIINDNSGDLEFWITDENGDKVSSRYIVNINKNISIKKMYEGWTTKKKTITIDMQGKELEDWLTYWRKEFHVPFKPGAALKRRIQNIAYFSKGFIAIASPDDQPESTTSLLERFAAVFNLTYTRFSDLQQAEAQAREARIETALERIRARALAMHSSEELMDVAKVLREQMALLGQPELETSVVHLYEEDPANILSWRAFRLGTNKDSEITYGYMSLPKNCCELVVDWITMFNSDATEYIIEVSGSKQKEWYKILAPKAPEIINAMRDSNSLEDKRYYHFSKFSGGALLMVSIQQPSEEAIYLKRRAAVVFDLAYRRFVDLKKAEAQARESQIELGLERVRARAMAMQTSGELAELVDTLFKELTKLDFTLSMCIINIIDEPALSNMVWAASPETGKPPESYYMKFEDYPFHHAMMKGYKERNSKFIYVLEGEEKKIYDEYLFNETEFRKIPEEGQAAFKAMEKYVASFSFSNFGGLQTVSNELLSESNLDILARFGKVFDLTYTRFNDLLRSEEQAREAQIEAGLERVRSRSLAMHNTSELQEVIHTVHKELLNLNIAINGGSFIAINKDVDTVLCCWGSGGTAETSEEVRLPLYEHPFCANLINRIKSAPGFFTEEYTQKEKKDFFTFLFKHEPWSKLDAKQKDDTLSSPGGYTRSCYVSQHTSIFIINHFGKKFSAADNDILERFGKVFEQAYTRFLDLQQAEAQTKEAKIEAALERVRARTMGMQKSDELAEVVGLMYKQFEVLDFGFYQVLVSIYDTKNKIIEWWSRGFGDVDLPQRNILPIIDHPFSNDLLDKWKSGVEFYEHVLGGEMKNSWEEHLFTQTDLKHFPEEIKDKMRSIDHVFLTDVFMKYGSLQAAGPAPLPGDKAKILKRFTKALDHAYTRMMDLQNAEAQTREAQIELGLERVRAKAMAMQKSDELKELIGTVYTELTKLDLILDRCFIMIYDNRSMGVTWWMSNPEAPSQPIGLFVKYHEQPPYLAFIKGWKERNLKWQYDLEGEVKKTWDKFLFVETELSQLPDFVITNMKANEKVYLSASFNNFGCLTLATLESLSDEHFDIMLRFAKVFDLTYTRFNDLKQAEAQTREAKIEAALERVRARALAMQEPEELKDVAQVLRNEMGELGVEELETCSIYINDEATNKTECWYALKDLHAEEKKLVSDHFPLNLSDTWVGREMKNFYGSDAKQVSIVMQGANRKEWINYCEERSVPFRGYYGEVIPDRTYHLYKFSHGAIGAAAAGDISPESWKLLSRAASVFSLAYSRFKDLTQARIDLVKLKEEKKRAEDALSDLQSAQKQLVQAEKMASLGELTAGIAHEIQNPLNFVNNFSDVSNELLEEMKAELEKGNAEEAKLIAGDVKVNLEKILHHGKRADAIVKGMLQHSRTNTGQKEPTDINVLAEEYLRLAYHGLRAKDKFFNAKFETDLDPSITKINIVPQEIGRVILNLINNSFYAVTEKKRTVSNGYEPNVTISTKRINDKVEIQVKDNGNGIPQKVLDKIFQPFFTTKPTGQGTGLGLSLSYDIVTKGHDGEIKVETKEGEGSAFTISLPMR